MRRIMSEPTRVAGTVAVEELGRCPRCSNYLTRSYSSEYPACLLCGYVDYGTAGKDLALKDGSRGVAQDGK